MEKGYKCVVYQSVYHWDKDCPHKDEQVKTDGGTHKVEDCYLTHRNPYDPVTLCIYPR